MQTEANTRRFDSLAPHPLSELLLCPPSITNLLSRSSLAVECAAGDLLFRQFDHCKGLYLVVSGQFQRSTERLEKRLVLGQVRAGDLVELAAVLGNQRHTYTLTALTSCSVLLLPIETLLKAFENHPPLHMHLLEELAREVSRGYRACWQVRVFKRRRTGDGATSK
jgi:CRP-like cAMP-binding protein